MWGEVCLPVPWHRLSCESVDQRAWERVGSTSCGPGVIARGLRPRIPPGAPKPEPLPPLSPTDSHTPACPSDLGSTSCCGACVSKAGHGLARGTPRYWEPDSSCDFPLACTRPRAGVHSPGLGWPLSWLWLTGKSQDLNFPFLLCRSSW